MEERLAPLPEVTLEEIAHRVGIHLEAALGKRQDSLEAKVDKLIDRAGDIGNDVAVSNERVRAHLAVCDERHHRLDRDFGMVLAELGDLNGMVERRLSPLEDKKLIQDTVLRFGSKTLILVGGTVLAAMGALGFAIVQWARATFGW